MAADDIALGSVRQTEDDRSRTGDIDQLVQQALSDPDPVGWMRARVADAIDRLEGLHAPAPVKAEAKRQLLSIERKLIAAIRRAGVLCPAMIVAYAALSRGSAFL